MAFTTDEETKLKNIITKDSLIDKLLLRQEKLDEIKEIDETAITAMNDLREQIKVIDDKRNDDINAVKQAIKDLNLG